MKMKFYGLLMVISVVFSCQGQTTSKEHLVNANIFERQMSYNKGFLIDVRTADEFEQGHIPGAQNIDFLKDDFEANTANFDKNAPLYVYCKSGGRSAKAVEKLRKQGYTKVYELDGGYNAWKERKSLKKSK